MYNSIFYKFDQQQGQFRRYWSNFFVNHILFVPFQKYRIFKRLTIDYLKLAIYCCVQGNVCQSQLRTWMHICGWPTTSFIRSKCYLPKVKKISRTQNGSLIGYIVETSTDSWEKTKCHGGVDVRKRYITIHIFSLSMSSQLKPKLSFQKLRIVRCVSIFASQLSDLFIFTFPWAGLTSVMSIQLQIQLVKNMKKMWLRWLNHTIQNFRYLKYRANKRYFFNRMAFVRCH